MARNIKEIYTRQLDGVLKLIIVNNESKNMRFMTWNGIEIFNDEMFLMIIANKASGNFNNVFAFNNQNRMGAIYLEDLNSIDDRIPLKNLYEKYKTSGRIVLLEDMSCEQLKENMKTASNIMLQRV